MVSERLTEIRKQRKLTMKDVAEAIGMKPDTYRNYESGRLEPNLSTLSKLADFYGVTTDYLLGRNSGKPEPLDEYAGTVNMSELEREIIDGYFKLDGDTRREFMDMLETAVKEVAAKSPVRWEAASSSDYHGSEVTELTAEEQQRLDNAADETKNSDNDL